MKLIYLIPLFIYSALDAKDKQKAYRKMVQNYSYEEKKIWEDFHYGLFLGSRNFVERIKSKYLTENPDVEIPQNDRY